MSENEKIEIDRTPPNNANRADAKTNGRNLKIGQHASSFSYF